MAEEALTRITGRLTENQRRILKLTLMGYSQQEIADMLGTCQQAVSQTMGRIRRKVGKISERG